MQNPDSWPQYVVIYEFDSKEDLEAFTRSNEAESAIKEFVEEWNDAGEFFWSGWYEQMKKLDRWFVSHIVHPPSL